MKIDFSKCELKETDPTICGWCDTKLIEGKCPRIGCIEEQEQNYKEYQEALIEDEKCIRENRPKESPFYCGE